MRHAHLVESFLEVLAKVTLQPSQVQGREGSMAIGELGMPAFTAHDLPEGMEPNLEAQVSWDPPNFTFPFGAHIVVTEVDSETGVVEITRYVAVDDCGNRINPMIVFSSTVLPQPLSPTQAMASPRCRSNWMT